MAEESLSYTSIVWELSVISLCQSLISNVGSAERIPFRIISEENEKPPIRYTYSVKVNKPMNDLIEKLTR